ncbi:HNH endonuclease [Pseudomonas sp. NFACC37-1]|uniref:HNH endonuclease n=1 Tax=Pseudomonas sp. NFACC37-1 TaxID=1566196 RepID=UPI00088E59F8|nr:HNH endonuclease [Pseudomonas sp. NFACC37-1]SCY34926.1 TIGR02646 family protein [Pseudomonas sp. NFACC37-1]
MFKVERPHEFPECNERTGYNTPDIVKALEKIFLGKCYLCEQHALSDPEIEHFQPHKGNPNLKFDWSNLYYACSRCNSIKGSSHTNLLDCCDPDTDVFSPIKLLVPARYDDDVEVILTEAKPSEKALNTAKLLDRCYNENSTGLRGITRQTLIELIYHDYHQLVGWRNTVTDAKVPDEEKATPMGRIKHMLQSKYPFSVFWKWWVLGDSRLLEAMPELKELAK